MNPKEKATALVAKYEAIEWNEWMSIGDAGFSEFFITINKDVAKQCALIAVEEILRTGLLSKSPIKHQAIADVHEEFWNQVKTEIEKL